LRNGYATEVQERKANTRFAIRRDGDREPSVFCGEGEGSVPQYPEKPAPSARSRKASLLASAKPSQEALLVPENDEDFARGRRLPLLLAVAAAAWIVLILLVIWGPTLLSLIAQLGLAGPVKVLPPLI